MVQNSGPLLFHCIDVSGTNTAAPRTNPSRQTFKPVIGHHKESRNSARPCSNSCIALRQTAKLMPV